MDEESTPYPEEEYVWLIEDGIRARIIRLGAHWAQVAYSIGGIDYEVVVESSDFMYWRNLGIVYDAED